MAAKDLPETSDGLKATSPAETEATTSRGSMASFSMAHALSIARRRKEEQRIAEEEQAKAEEEERKDKARAKRRRRRQNQKLARAKLKAELGEGSKQDQADADIGGSSESNCDHPRAGKRPREADDDSIEQSPKRQRGEGSTEGARQQAVEACPQDQPVRKLLTLIPRALLIKKSNN